MGHKEKRKSGTEGVELQTLSSVCVAPSLKSNPLGDTFLFAVALQSDASVCPDSRWAAPKETAATSRGATGATEATEAAPTEGACSRSATAEEAGTAGTAVAEPEVSRTATGGPSRTASGDRRWVRRTAVVRSLRHPETN